MTRLTSKEVFKALDEGLEAASRWPRLLPELGFAPEQGRPGALLLNNAFQRLGFGRVLDEDDSLRLLLDEPLPDVWWQRIALAITGNASSTVDQVVTRLRQAHRAAAE